MQIVGHAQEYSVSPSSSNVLAIRTPRIVTCENVETLPLREFGDLETPMMFTGNSRISKDLHGLKANGVNRTPPSGGYAHAAT